MPEPPPCPYSPGCSDPDRHSHAYKPTHHGQRQCRCGSRQWKVNVSGPLPVMVSCARCKQSSRLNTAYEAGRAHGRAEALGTASGRRG